MRKVWGTLKKLELSSDAPRALLRFSRAFQTFHEHHNSMIQTKPEIGFYVAFIYD